MEVKKYKKDELVSLLPPLIREDVANYIRMENLYESAIKEIHTRIEILDDEYEIRFERNPIHHIEQRIKSPDSIFKKLKKYGFELSLESAMDNIKDIGGIRVVCYCISDVYDIANTLYRQDDIKVVYKKDYIKSPKDNGYRSLHLVLEVPVYTIEEKKVVPIEVQIRTIAMDYYASIEHQIKYKGNNKVSNEIQKELTDCADIIASTDEIMESIYQKTRPNKKN